MTQREVRIEIRRLKEHEAWLTNRYLDELKKTKKEIAKLRKVSGGEKNG